MVHSITRSMRYDYGADDVIESSDDIIDREAFAKALRMYKRHKKH